MLPIRGLLFAILTNPIQLVLIQALDGIAATCLGVLVPLVTSDIAGRSGRFNLSLGFIGLAIGLGATASTSLAGWVADRFGTQTAFACPGRNGADRGAPGVERDAGDTPGRSRHPQPAGRTTLAATATHLHHERTREFMKRVRHTKRRRNRKFAELSAGGNRIRTIGPAEKETAAERPRGRLSSPRETTWA